MAIAIWGLFDAGDEFDLKAVWTWYDSRYVLDATVAAAAGWQFDANPRPRLTGIAMPGDIAIVGSPSYMANKAYNDYIREMNDRGLTPDPYYDPLADLLTGGAYVPIGYAGSPDYSIAPADTLVLPSGIILNIFILAVRWR